MGTSAKEGKVRLDSVRLSGTIDPEGAAYKAMPTGEGGRLQVGARGREPQTRGSYHRSKRTHPAGRASRILSSELADLPHCCTGSSTQSFSSPAPSVGWNPLPGNGTVVACVRAGESLDLSTAIRPGPKIRQSEAETLRAIAGDPSLVVLGGDSGVRATDGRGMAEVCLWN